ncbi:MAG: hypothetical protein KAV00_15885 [Phycisphaerae bacterium]|nr:hypothetical protein [Phycisphaerae bacterium]
MVDFVAEAERCIVCDSALRNLKSYLRLHPVMSGEAGPFIPRVVLKRCKKDKNHPVAHSEALARIVMPRQRYAYDLIVQVGLARYHGNKRRDEICAELYEQHRIKLSEASVSNVCDRFLHYFEALHLVRAPYLRAAIQNDGGYPLHLDGTSDRGKGGLAVCMDGFRDWVLVAGKIPSEHEDHLRPLVDKTVALFGDPLSTMRDLMKAGPNVVAAIRDRGNPDLVCHFHFLGAVGKKLFEVHYSTLRELLKQSKVRSESWELLRELRRYRKSDSFKGRFGSGRVRDDLLALVLWVLEGDGRKKPSYPFALSHLEFYQRCRQAMQRAERWVPSPRTQLERSALQHLSKLVGRVERDERFAQVAGQLEKSWIAFCELRDVLRLTGAVLLRGETPVHQKVVPAVELELLQAIEEAADQYMQRLRSRVGDQSKKKPSTPEGVILKYLERYSDNLFGQPVLRDDQGAVVAVADRTNNVPEHFFAQGKENLRRRLGKAHLGRDLEDQPAQAALVANLRHDDYVRVLCGSLDNLANAFADLDQKALSEATPLARESRDSDIKSRIRALLDQEAEPSGGPPQAAKAPEIGLDATIV